MSYDVSLISEFGMPLEISERFSEGGTYPVDGTKYCELNITYNYQKVFGDLVRNLHGRTAEETIPALEAFAAKHEGAAASADYWEATPGNALAAIKRLLSFAHAHPDGVWEIC